MAHHRSSHPKTERDYHLRFNQLKQAITTLKSQIEQETALIQSFKGPANVLLALFAGHHRRQSLSEIAQARQRLNRLGRELAELQAEEETLTAEWERRKDQLRQAAELAAKDEALQQGFKQVRLEEQRLALEEREAKMKKQLLKKQLLEEEKLLEKQTAETNKRLVEVRRHLKEYEESK
jgi:chromosome segregation ATPase